MTQPASAMPPARAAVLVALIRLHGLNGRATIRELCLASGIRGTATVHDHLTALARAGLVAWEPAKAGTLRPLVKVMP